MTYSTERTPAFLLVHVTRYEHQCCVCPHAAVVSGAAVRTTHSCYPITEKKQLFETNDYGV